MKYLTTFFLVRKEVRKDCNELVVKLHAIGELKDELLLPITGMKC